MKKVIALLLITAMLSGCGTTIQTETVRAKVVTGDEDNDGYIIATNVNDSSDTFAIEKEKFGVGDIVTITFEDGEVVGVQ